MSDEVTNTDAVPVGTMVEATPDGGFKTRVVDDDAALTPASDESPYAPAPETTGGANAAIAAAIAGESDEQRIAREAAQALSQAIIHSMVGTDAQQDVHTEETPFQKLVRFLHLMPPMSSIVREDSGAYSVQLRGNGLPRHGARTTLLHAFEEAHGEDVDAKYAPVIPVPEQATDATQDKQG